MDVLNKMVISQFTPQQMNTYFSIFCRNADVMIGQIEQMTAAGNLPMLKGVAHKLKGSSLTVGATQIKELAHDIERSAAEGRNASSAHLAELHAAFDALKATLKKDHALTF